MCWLSDQAFSHHLTQEAVLGALDEARPAFQAEGIRRWVQLYPGMAKDAAGSDSRGVAGGEGGAGRAE